MVLYLTCELFADQKFKMAAMRKLSLTLGPRGISIFIFFSETTEQISTQLGRNVKQLVLCQIFEISADQKINIAARANYVF